MPARPHNEITIRRAKRSEIPLLVSFIRDLGEYERLLDHITVTEASLERWLFGRKRAAEAILAHSSGEAVAYAIYFHNFSTFLGAPGLYIEDIFVKEEHRRTGVGSAMLAHLAGLAKDRGCERMEWSVLDWNEPARRLYSQLGAVAQDDWTGFRLTGAALDSLAGRG